MKNLIGKNFKELLTLDLRSLGLMRIAVSLTLIIDLIIRFSDLDPHYTNQGILPLEALFRHGWSHYNFSIYTITGSYELLSLLFLLNLMAALCLLFGYKTRVFTIVCWIFLLSLHNRNPFILQAGDDFLRLTLFWAIFLPWGYCYSIDNLKMSRLPEQGYSYFSLAALAYVLQIFSMYFFSALLKSGPEWNSEFTALYYTLSLDQILLPAGKLLYSFPELLIYLTAVVYYIELVFPFILFSPYKKEWCRGLFFVVISLFHIGIALCLNVGLFPLISVACMTGLIPTRFIEFIASSGLFRKTGIMMNKWRALIGFPAEASFPKENFTAASLAFFFLCMGFLWNIQTSFRPSSFSIEKENWIVRIFRIDQNWGMFAPAVFRDDGWFILEGRTAKGEVIDILQEGKKPEYNKPVYVAGMFKNDRWRKYSENVLMIHYNFLRPYYCSYMMNRWNSEHEENISKLDIIYMKEVTLPGYKTEPVKKEILCSCELK